VADTDAGQGFLTSFELSIWVPIVKQQTITRAEITESAWFVPLIYTAPTVSVVTGREVYGYPKVPAFFQLSGEGLPIAIQSRYTLGGAALPLGGADHFCAPSSSPDRQTNSRLSDEPLLAQAVTRYLANHAVVFRKQVGLREDAGHPPLARYNALVEARLPLTRIRDLCWSTCSTPFTNIPEVVSRELGLVPSCPPFQVSIRDATLDSQHGREIWVSKGSLPLVQAVPAFPEEPKPGVGTFDIRGAAPSPFDFSPARAAPGLLRGTGEAYFVDVRPSAIAALLKRDFPRHEAWKITADTTRDFVMLLLLRAAEDAKVRLYEFGIWVPIEHDGQQAWYVPYMFRSPGAAVVHAREWFGHPCQEAFITFEATTPERSVRFRQPIAHPAPRVQWTPSDGVELELFEGARPALSQRRSWLPQGQVRVVGLRQVRHAADTTRACVQELITSAIDFQAKIQDPPILRRVHLSEHLRLGHLLDLDGEHSIAVGWGLEQLQMNTTVASPDHSVHDYL
jgi:hypothetical protein